MTITTNDILVTVLAGRPPTPALVEWLKQWPPENVKTPQPSGQMRTVIGDMICVWRNRIVMDFLENYTLPYLMMVDSDAWPVSHSDAIIQSDGPVIACHCINRRGKRAHGTNGSFCLHCFRVSRQALLAMQASPAFDAERGWFAIEADNNGTKFAACDCQYFCRLARSAGFEPVKVAPMGHLMPMVVLPGETGGARIEFPEALLYGDTDIDNDSADDGGS